MRTLRPIPYVNVVGSNEVWQVPNGYWAIIANVTQVTVESEFGGYVMPSAWMKTAGEETGLPRVWGGVRIKGKDGASAQVYLHPIPRGDYSHPCLEVEKKGCGCGDV